MCRVLVVRANEPFAMGRYLSAFAAACRDSKEYQGHGWGLAYRSNRQWHSYKHLEPIWRHDLTAFGETDFLLAHARSAFRNEDIVLANNMPFLKSDCIFAFNGELHGVRLKVPGRIGAEKIFNFILRLRKDDLAAAFENGGRIIRERSEYVRASNIVMTDGERLFVSTHFNEDPDYFTLHHKPGNPEIICSVPLEPDWRPIPNRTTAVLDPPWSVAVQNSGVARDVSFEQKKNRSLAVSAKPRAAIASEPCKLKCETV